MNDLAVGELLTEADRRTREVTWDVGAYDAPALMSAWPAFATAVERVLAAVPGQPRALQALSRPLARTRRSASKGFEPDERLAHAAQLLDRAARLIEAYAMPPASAAHAANAANTRARVLQILHVGAHVSAAALREHEGRLNPALAGQRFTPSPAKVTPGLGGSIALARSLTFETLEAAAADAVSRNGFERIRTDISEERDWRLTDSLGAWTEVSQSLLTQKVPAADDWATITRTYADISVHAVVLLNAAADQGVINGDEFQVLAPQLQAMHDGWAAVEAAWPSHLRTTQAHVDPTLRDARSNLTQTLNSITHDEATWSEPATIAGRCDLPMVIADLRTSLRGSSQTARDLGALPERLVAAGALRGGATKLNDLLPPESRRPQDSARKVVDVCTGHLEPLGLSTAAAAQAQRVDQVLAGMENTPDPRTAGAVRPPAQLGYDAVERLKRRSHPRSALDLARETLPAQGSRSSVPAVQPAPEYGQKTPGRRR